VASVDYRYQVGSAIKTVRIERNVDSYTISVDEKTYTVEVDRLAPGECIFRVDGQPRRAHVASDKQNAYVAINGEAYTLTRVDTTKAKRRTTSASENSLTASMPGQVVRILVNEGDHVERGQPLILLEAMKMEIRITAPHDGKIARVMCSAGQIVERGQPLIELSD
jgi:3-methylcrotonyl-CoA carboxylase alpha subunit